MTAWKKQSSLFFWLVLCEMMTINMMWWYHPCSLCVWCELKPRVFSLVCIPSLVVKLTWLLAAAAPLVFVPCCVINFPFPLWAFLLSFISSSRLSLCFNLCTSLLTVYSQLHSLLYKTWSNVFSFCIMGVYAYTHFL